MAPLDAELPSEAEIERVRGETTDEKSLEQQLDRYRDDIEEWVKNKHSYVVIHALIRDQVPCSESTVRRYVKRAFPEVADAVMRRPTVVGEVMEVDFGYLGITYDAHSGRNRRTYVFSARFRHSRRAWRECVFDQTQQTFFCCHIHAFEFFGGVPERVVPDNLKAAVVKASHEDPIVNRAYRALAEHYGFLIDPCRPYRPEHKGGVENDIKRNFWPIYQERQKQRGYETPQADTLQSALEEWSATVADTRIIKGVGRSPQEIFETEEDEALRPVPPTRWDPLSWAQPKVGAD